MRRRAVPHGVIGEILGGVRRLRMCSLVETIQGVVDELGLR
jgi:hypothetical protein